MSADSNGIDVELVFKNNSADVVGSVFHDMMSNFYNPTGVCLTVRNMFTIYHSYLSFQRYTIYHSRGILFIIPEVYYLSFQRYTIFMFLAVVTQKHVYISVAYNSHWDNNRH